MIFACAAGMAGVGEPKVLGTCQLGAEARQLVTILAKDPQYGRDTVYLRLGWNTPGLALYAEEEIEESRGPAVVVQCAGDRENVAVIFGELGSSNYPRCQLIRYHGNGVRSGRLYIEVKVR